MLWASKTRGSPLCCCGGGRYDEYTSQNIISSNIFLLSLELIQCWTYIPTRINWLVNCRGCKVGCNNTRVRKYILFQNPKKKKKKKKKQEKKLHSMDGTIHLFVQISLQPGFIVHNLYMVQERERERERERVWLISMLSHCKNLNEYLLYFIFRLCFQLKIDLNIVNEGRIVDGRANNDWSDLEIYRESRGYKKKKKKPVFVVGKSLNFLFFRGMETVLLCGGFFFFFFQITRFY